MLYREEDMPYTVDGEIPSLIMNPHAIPSRMTIGQLKEALLAKWCAAAGALGDATPFRAGASIDELSARLARMGLERHGDELAHNPRTGHRLAQPLHMSLVYYQRLKHMTDDKVHSRAANGPVVLLTRQPAEGRARDGGLRVGEMEVECMWAHGSMYFLYERFMPCSDNYRVFTCRRCGLVAAVNPERGVYQCRACKNAHDFHEVRVPYACKLLLQELQSMGVAARFVTR